MSVELGDVLTISGFEYFANEMLNVTDSKLDSSGPEITAINSAISGLQSAVADLQYTPIEITACVCSPTIAELGSSVNVTVTWETNKNPVTLTFDGAPVTGSSKAINGVTSDKTYTVVATDEKQNSSTKTASIVFVNQVYYGAAANSDSITTLMKTLSGIKARTITASPTAGQYIYYAYPVRLGAAAFYVSGFEGGFEAPETKSITNGSGHTENYYVYRSTNASLGQTTVTIV